LPGVLLQLAGNVDDRPLSGHDEVVAGLIGLVGKEPVAAVLAMG
jgi:hypothetical protein